VQVEDHMLDLTAYGTGTVPVQPAWLSLLQSEARQAYARTGLPSRRLEAWKYTDLRALDSIALGPLPADGRSDGSALGGLPASAQTGVCRLVFVHGRLREDLGSRPCVAGLDIQGLRAALDAGDPDLGRHIGRIAEVSSSPMLALNTAMAGDGFILRVARSHALEAPIELVFVNGPGDDPLAFHPRGLIVLEDGAAATILETHIGSGAVPYLSNCAIEISLATGASLRHYRSIREAAAGWHVSTTAVQAATDSRYEAFGLLAGGRLVRNEIAVRLEGTGAHCTVAGAYMVRDDEHCDNTTRVDHLAERTSCNEIFRGVIGGRARAVFQGNIVVHPGAQHADAHQLSRALLLSDDAEIDQKPELEIYADNVKCSHGASAGQLDDRALFYLRSRGLNETLARRLLIEGFLTECFDNISDETARAAFLDDALTWLRA
jgi:Fe-S cluster assembly protein SufD